ncbi:MAG: methionine transporter ATP-binding protein [Ilumatobacteraceae bacterium]|nr:methionine transporter ATP-binding protein [Ilumatobacteraceae bacterium]
MTASTTTSDVPAATAPGDPLLQISNLSVEASTSAGTVRLVDGLDFEMRRGEVRAIVGESGSGKSTVCLAILRLLAENARISSGTITFDGERIDDAREPALRQMRGRKIGIVFQDPLSALDPVRRIGPQLGEARRVHGLGSRGQVAGWVRETLGSLGFSNPARSARSFPNMLSGGMRQRVCVGIAFSAEPKLVIADEPTTALDVSLQGRLLRLLLARREASGTAVLLVSHDVAVVRAVADRVTVMFGGMALEEGPAADVFAAPGSPYTAALLASVPTMSPERRRARMSTIPVATVAPSPSGCPFAGRCRREVDACRQAPPPTVWLAPAHHVRCFNPERQP